jgi:hypothetical protein
MCRYEIHPTGLAHESTYSSDIPRDYLSRVAYVFATYKLNNASVLVTEIYVKSLLSSTTVPVCIFSIAAYTSIIAVKHM